MGKAENQEQIRNTENTQNTGNTDEQEVESYNKAQREITDQKPKP